MQGRKKAQERLEWRSTTESRDYSRINSLLVYVGTEVSFYRGWFRRWFPPSRNREQKESVEQILRKLRV